MTDKLIDHICKEINTYASQKGNQKFKIDSNEMKSFLVVLLLSGYIPYAERSMYWEMCLDKRNTIVASLFPRNRFLNVLQYLHLADNNNLNPSDKFSKVNPLLRMMNESCLENFIPEKNISLMSQWYLIMNFMVANNTSKTNQPIWLQAMGSSHSLWLWYTVLSLCQER